MKVNCTGLVEARASMGDGDSWRDCGVAIIIKKMMSNNLGGWVGSSLRGHSERGLDV